MIPAIRMKGPMAIIFLSRLMFLRETFVGLP